MTINSAQGNKKCGGENLSVESRCSPSSSAQFSSGTDYNFKHRIVWFNAIGFLLLHLCALYGLFLIGKCHIYTLYSTFITIVITALSVTMGAHRLYSHKAFKAHYIIRCLLVTFQTVSGQNCLYIWVRDHRQHHKYSDTDADPHNAHRGFFFSHVGWLMSRKHPLVIEKGKNIDMSDLEADPLVMFQKKYYKPLYVIFALYLPILLPVYLWDESIWNSLFVSYFLRYVLVLNGTWLINSAAHLYGNKPYDKQIMPVENSLVSIIAIGEAFHNYHHAFPWDYQAAESGLHYSFTTFMIEACAYFGLCYDLRTANNTMIRHRVTKKGDGSHVYYGSKAAPLGSAHLLYQKFIKNANEETSNGYAATVAQG